MSMRTSRLILSCLFSATVVLGAIGPVPAQEPRDLLKEAKQRQEVELQRVKADYKETNDEATKLARDNVAKAIVMLRSLRERVQNNADISATERDGMLKTLNLRITAMSERVSDDNAAIANAVAASRQQEEKPQGRRCGTTEPATRRGRTPAPRRQNRRSGRGSPGKLARTIRATRPRKPPSGKQPSPRPRRWILTSRSKSARDSWPS